MFFVGVLKITDEKNSIRSRDLHLDPLVKGTDTRYGSIPDPYKNVTDLEH